MMDSDSGRRKKGRLVNETGLLTHRYSKPFFRRYTDISGLDEKTRGELDRIGRIIAQKCLQTMRNGGLRQYHMKKWIGPLMAWMSVDVYDNGLGAPLVTVEVKSRPLGKLEEPKVPGLFIIQGEFILEANPALNVDGGFIASYDKWRLFKKPGYIKDGFYCNGYAATTEDNDNETRTVALSMIDEDGKHWVCGYGAQQLHDVSDLNEKRTPIVRWCYSDGNLLGLKADTTITNPRNFQLGQVLKRKTVGDGWDVVAEHLGVPADDPFYLLLANQWSAEYNQYCTEFWQIQQNEDKRVHVLTEDDWTSYLKLGTPVETTIDNTGPPLPGPHTTDFIGNPVYFGPYDNAACGEYGVGITVTVGTYSFISEDTATKIVQTSTNAHVNEIPLLLLRTQESYRRVDSDVEISNTFSYTNGGSTYTSEVSLNFAYWLFCVLWVNVGITEALDPLMADTMTTIPAHNEDTVILYGSTEVRRVYERTKASVSIGRSYSVNNSGTYEFGGDDTPIIDWPPDRVDTLSPVSVVQGDRMESIVYGEVPVSGIELIGIWYKLAPDTPYAGEATTHEGTKTNIWPGGGVQYTEAELYFELRLNNQIVPVNWTGTIVPDRAFGEVEAVALPCSNVTADGTFVFVTTILEEAPNGVSYIMSEDYTELWGYSSLDETVTNLNDVFDDIDDLKQQLQNEILQMKNNTEMGWDRRSVMGEYKLLTPAIRGLAKTAVPL